MELPGLLTSTFYLDGDFEEIAVNLMNRLEQHPNWNIGYLETYINASDESVYLISGVQIVRVIPFLPFSEMKGIRSFTVKVIESQSKQTEIVLATRHVAEAGMPRQVEVDKHYQAHNEVGREIEKFCTQSTGGILEIVQKVIDTIRGRVEKQKR